MRLGKIASAVRFWASSPAPGAAELIDLLAARASEVIPDSVDVAADKAGITLEYRDSHGVRRGTILIGLVLRSAMGPRESLDLALTMFSQGLQNVVTKVTGSRWPDEMSTPHFTVGGGHIQIWWGRQSRDEASVRVRTIAQSELPAHWRDGGDWR